MDLYLSIIQSKDSFHIKFLNKKWDLVEIANISRLLAKFQFYIKKYSHLSTL